MRFKNRIQKNYEIFFSAACICLVGCLCSCSSSSSAEQKNNYVSPYDREFDNDDSDNAAADVDIPEDELLEKAKSAYDSGLYSVARENWTKLREQYPSSYYATLAELKNGDTYYYSGDFPASITAYEEFIKLHPAHDATPYVRMQIGNAYREQYAGVSHDQLPLQSAIKSYQKLLDEYPRSEYAVAARRAIVSCRDQLAQHDLYIARFYAKQGMEDASNGRFKRIIDQYPDTDTAKVVREEIAENNPDLLSAKTPARNPDRALEPPKKPQLILAQDDDTREARFRMLDSLPAATSQEPVAAAPKIDSKPNAPASKSPVLWVNCEENKDFLIYTAALRRPLDNHSMDSGSEVQTDVLLAPRESKVFGSEISKVVQNGKSCEIGATALNFFSVKNRDEEAFTIAELSNVPARRVNSFVIDRPYRLVLIVEK